ncbi:MAG: enoyl-CoA hydratase/isomerase family protein [Proteobacteria bacterium]|nr:enoyl-CoA hydratase/isomerase family protein [Pseudomonadota bacterium]
MKSLLEEKDSIAILKLNNGVTNAISQDLIDDLSKKLDIIEKNFKGLIIRGNEKFFSMGFNLPELIVMDKSSFEKFYESFNELILKIFTLPLPTISVIEGHAVAGGFIIAISTDYRIALADKKLGLNEINLGVPVPFLAIELLERLSGKRIAENLLYSGDLIKTQDALRFSIVDEIIEPNEIFEKTVEKIKNLASKPQRAFENIKSLLITQLKEKYTRFKELDKEKFLECWYTEEAQTILKETAKKF